MGIVTESMRWSILAQAITGVVSAQGLFMTVAPEHAVLQDLLKIETGVQAVELFFYSHFLTNTDLADMAKIRYYDWVLTTPVMLFTTMAYLEYKNARPDQNLTLADFVDRHGSTIAEVLAYNMAMLAFGYAYEIGAMSKAPAAVLGSLAFVGAFKKMRDTFGGSRFLDAMTAVWGLYGVAFLLPDAEKNTCLNILDVIAKNFFGVFLFLELRRVH